MFPISDSVKSQKTPYVTLFLIAVNIYVFVRYLLLGDLDAVIAEYALIPQFIDFRDPSTLFPLISSQFLHGGFFHIISNMLFLWVFGDNVEERMGSVKFFFFYLAAGVAGGILQYAFHTDSFIPMLGASGAVSGVLGAYYVLFPHHKIKSVVFLFFIVTILNIPAGFYLLYWFVIQFFQGIASIPSISMDTGGTAFFAHIGGFVAGYIVAKRLSRPKKEYIEGEIIE